MQVEALGLSQEMDFSDGGVTNFLTLRLPSGDLVKALVSDAAVERIAANLAGLQTGQPVLPADKPPAARASVEPVTPSPDHPDAFIFGGPAIMGTPIPTPPPVRPKIVRVEADSKGNPIVQMEGGNNVDPQMLIAGGFILDEDGIGQG